MYEDNTATSSTTYTDYVWSEIAGEIIIDESDSDIESEYALNKSVVESGNTANDYIVDDVLTIGKYFPMTIEDGNADFSKGHLRIDENGLKLSQYIVGLPDYEVCEFAIGSGQTSNGWDWIVYNSGHLRAICIDKYTPTGTNSSFVSGLYYKDTTKSLSALFDAVEDAGFTHYRDWASYGGIIINATTNGNSGSGYVTAWRCAYNSGTEVINTRYVSSSSANMGTVTTSYTVDIYLFTGNSTFDGE